jgi:hypothetical protein
VWTGLVEVDGDGSRLERFSVMVGVGNRSNLEERFTSEVDFYNLREWTACFESRITFTRRELDCIENYR